MPPQWTDLILTTDIPDIEFDILVGHALDVESDCGDSGDILVEFQFIQNGLNHQLSVCNVNGVAGGSSPLTGLSGSVETEHEDAHLLGSEDLAH